MKLYAVVTSHTSGSAVRERGDERRAGERKMCFAGETRARHGLLEGARGESAREPAQRGCELTLVSRREDRLQTLRQELCAQYGVDVFVVPAALAAPGATQRLYEEVKDRSEPVDVLVNNAGFGIYG